MPEDQPLFDPAEFPVALRRKDAIFAPIHYPLWTKHKARLIARYLYYFVMITKHGTYIDGFAGPQNERPEMWAAKLVIESEPRWLRHFHLVELNATKVAALRRLKRTAEARPTKPKRVINVYQGDFNTLVDQILSSGSITPKEAAFCLLDQRTFECHWRTLEKLAAYKPPGDHKIELFYFLPISWLDRAFCGTRNEDPIVHWWGRSDWRVLVELRREQRAAAFVDRIKNELGYASVVPWPIYDRRGGRRVMYYMIHATDHPEAPKLMRRAYTRAVDPIEPIRQLKLAWATGAIDS